MRILEEATFDYQNDFNLPGSNAIEEMRVKR
jgi:hypothetical protein